MCMSNLSEAAAENDDRVDETVAGAGTDRPGVLSTTPSADRRAPFDFRLKLDLGGARAPERGLPLFEARVARRPTPTLTPMLPPEPVLLEPIAFSLDALRVSGVVVPRDVVVDLDVTPKADERPPQTSQRATNEVPTVEATPAVEPETTKSAVVEASVPILPKPAPRLAAPELPSSEQRAAAIHPPKVGVPRHVDVTMVPAHQDRRKKRKGLLVFFVVLGLLGGGGFAIMKQRQAAAAKVKAWPAALKPLATFVEQTLGHSFSKSVPVVTLAQAEYEVKLGIFELARVPKDTTDGLSGLRALGLVSNAPSAAEIGEYVGFTRTAFYDPATATVYQAPDLTGAFQAANVISALSAAMIDQDKNWGTALASLSPSQRLGYLSLIEGTGTFAVRKKVEQDVTFADAYSKEQTDRVARRDALHTKVDPWLAGLFDLAPAASQGIVTRALQGDFLDALNVPTSDAAVLDSARGLDTPAGAVTTDKSTMGMYVWYGLLYPALGDQYAFAVASAWTGDSATYSIAAGRGCIRASVATRDAASLTDMVNGLKLWAKSRPADTGTTVEAGGTVAIVTACEPTGSVVLNSASKVKSDFNDRFAKEQVLLQQLKRLAMPLTGPTVACAVKSYRGDGLAAFDNEIASVIDDTQGDISVALRQSLQDLATFCSSVR